MNKRIYYIPIESLAERYTEQWFRWFPKEFQKAGYEVIVIQGESLTDKIETGEFLDINSTLHFKASQLKKIGKLFYEKKIKPNDIFFIADLEFWGIESIRYLSVLNNIPVKIYAFLHAASYTPNDFMRPCEPFAQYFENGWLKICDKIFVASEYHKNLVLEHRGHYGLRDKLIVTGNAWNTDEALKLVGKYKKKNQIIYSDLPDYRKRPDIFLGLVPIIKSRFPNIDIVLTTSRDQWGKGIIRDTALVLEGMDHLTIREGLSKKEYYTILAESKIMISTNVVTESFGYCACEALTFDTNPILPNQFSYPELCKGNMNLLYDIFDEIPDKIKNLLNNPISTIKYAKQYNDSIKRMIKEL